MSKSHLHGDNIFILLYVKEFALLCERINFGLVYIFASLMKNLQWIPHCLVILQCETAQHSFTPSAEMRILRALKSYLTFLGSTSIHSICGLYTTTPSLICVGLNRPLRKDFHTSISTNMILTLIHSLQNSQLSPLKSGALLYAPFTSLLVILVFKWLNLHKKKTKILMPVVGLYDQMQQSGERDRSLKKIKRGNVSFKKIVRLITIRFLTSANYNSKQELTQRQRQQN